MRPKDKADLGVPLNRPSRAELLERLRDALAASGNADPDAGRRLNLAATEALERMDAEGPEANLSARQRAAREAIVIVDGSRPLLLVRDDDIAPDLEGASAFWRDALSLRRRAIRSVLKSVGRVQMAGGPDHAGTAWVVAENRIVTNRHVLQAIACERGGSWTFPAPCWVDFVAEADRTAGRRFPITGVTFCSEGLLAAELELDRLDIAVLSTGPGIGGVRFPAALRIAETVAGLDGDEIYTVGFPGRPPSAGHTGSAPPEGHEFDDVIALLLGGIHGVKRLSPGLVTADFAAGGEVRCICHDASTLGGSSGSPLVDLRGDGSTVVGLHLAGAARDRNYAHAVAGLRDLVQAGTGLMA